MKIKKIILAFIAVLLFNTANALPVYYCGQYGNAYAISWFTNSQGNLDFNIESAGTCVGGPYTLGAYIMSDQEGLLNGTAEATTSVYDAIKLFDFAGVQNQNAKLDYAAVDAIKLTMPGIAFCYVSPDKISFDWAKELANDESKSIFALSLRSQPFVGTIKFDVWSIRNQDIIVRLININTGLTVYQTTLSLLEGKNEKEKVLYNNLQGNYLMTITSDINVISRTVILQ